MSTALFRHHLEEIKMNVQSLKFALPVLVVAFALPAFAEDVSFTTTGEFFCGTVVSTNGGTCTATNATPPSDGTSTIIIANGGHTATVNVAGDSYAGLQAGNPGVDDVNVAQFSSTASTGAAVNTNGATFDLVITQTLPTSEGGTLSGAFSGTIGNKSQTNGASVTFSDTTLQLGNVLYTLDASSFSIGNPGINTIGMNQITATVTPEPTFMMLTGLGFAGLAFVAYRRRQAV
jgi:hypothetical protein